jgi:hypothetical protein
MDNAMMKRIWNEEDFKRDTLRIEQEILASRQSCNCGLCRMRRRMMSRQVPMTRLPIVKIPVISWLEFFRWIRREVLQRKDTPYWAEEVNAICTEAESKR